MEDFIYCSICLVTNVKMFEMNPTMHRFYVDILQVKNYKRKMLPQTLFACYECTHLMFKYWEFKEKCTTAYSVIMTATGGTFKVTERCLKNINREVNQLQSNLCIATETYSIPEYKTPNDIEFDRLKREVLENSVPENTDVRDSKDLSKSLVDRKCLYFDEDSVDMRQLLSDNQVDNKSYTDDMQDPDFNNGVYIIKVMNSDESDDNEDDCFDEYVESNIIIDEDNNKLHAIIENNIILNEENENQHDIEQELKRDEQESDEQNSDAENQNPDFGIDSEDDELNSILAKHKVPDGIADCNVEEEINQAINKYNMSMLPKGTPQKIKPKVERAMEEVLKINNDSKKKLKGIFANDLDFYESYATITVLTPEEAKNELLRRKESRNYKRCKYKCDICFRGYNFLETYQNHMKLHSKEQGSFECTFCKIWRPTKRTLRNHIENCHKYKFVCKHCPYVSYSTTQCRSHISGHKGEKHACKICGKTYKYAHSVHSHYRLRHQLDIPCDLCGATYGSDKGLLAHKNLVHKKDVNQLNGPKCEECNVHFTDERAYKRHLVLSTKHKVSNGCRVCGEAFKDPSDLREHRKIHEQFDYKKRKAELNEPIDMEVGDANIESEEELEMYIVDDDGNIIERKKLKVSGKDIGEKQDENVENNGKDTTFKPCIYCNTPIFSKKEFKMHTLNDHPESELASKLRCGQSSCNICEICGKTFSLETHLLVHQRIHTGEKPYTCEQCGKTFRTPIVLRTHMVTHTKEYNYSCHLCGRAFATKGVLKKHLRYHSDLRPFKCTGCDRSFVHRCEMKKHAMHVHNKVPWPTRPGRKRKKAPTESEPENDN